MTPYHRAENTGDWPEEYDMLVGPDGFACLLTEPEDRTWWRDGKTVVERLNEQYAEIERLRKQREDEIDEFNAGWDAARNGEPIDNDPGPPEDHWRNGWCAFHGDSVCRENG